MKKYIKHFPGIFLLCVIFGPPLKFLPSILTAVRAEDFLLAPMAAIVLFDSRWKRPTNNKRDLIPALFTYLGLCGMIGMLIGVLSLNITYVARDFILIPQIIKYIFIYLVMKRFLSISEVAETTKRYLLISSFLLAIVGIAQYWDLFNINSWLTPIYFSEEEVSEITYRIQRGYSLRISGTMGNGNMYGFVLAWFAGFVLAIYRSSQNKKSPFLYVLAFMLLVLASFLTQSRSTILSFAMLVMLVFISSPEQVKRRNKSSFRTIALVVLVLVAVLGLIQMIETSERRFGNRLTTSSYSFTRSLNARIRDFRNPIKYVLLRNPQLIPFGQGPSKAWFRTDSHNQIGWILQRFGLVGLLMYLSILWILFKRAYRLFKMGQYDIDYTIIMFAFLALCVWGFRDMTNAFFKLPQIMAFNLFSAGWLAAEWSKISHDPQKSAHHQQYDTPIG